MKTADPLAYKNATDRILNSTDFLRMCESYDRADVLPAFNEFRLLWNSWPEELRAVMADGLAGLLLGVHNTAQHGGAHLCADCLGKHIVKLFETNVLLHALIEANEFMETRQ